MLDNDEHLKANINDLIGHEISEGINASDKSIDERLSHFAASEKLILESESDSLLDNFFEEMTGLAFEKEVRIRCFAISFIEKACKKDPDIFLKAVDKLNLAMLHTTSGQSRSVTVQKRLIITCTLLYPLILRWASAKRSVDTDARNCWDSFSMLKERIMQDVNSDNEGIRTLVFKFHETVILCHTSKTEFSEIVKTPYQMSLDEISRDSFISHRKLTADATQCFSRSLDYMDSENVAPLNLITIISCCCNIAKQRPEFFSQVIGSFEKLHVNLSSTLSSRSSFSYGQAKSVRKELKNHLLRMLRHPATFSNHHRLTQLLLDLGASQSDIQKAMPAPGDISEALKKRVAAAQASASASGILTTSSATGTQRKFTEDTDLRDVKRFKLDDDDDYDDATTELIKQLDDLESAATATQKAIDITTNWVFDRLSLSVVTKLVLISLYTLPEEMPSSFASSYTPASLGNEEQRQKLARMMAILLTKEGEGPGVQYIKSERQKLYMERQAVRSEGSVIPQTQGHAHNAAIDQSTAGKENEKFVALQPVQKKINPKSFNLFTITRQLMTPEAHEMIIQAFHRILNSEKRAVQGGAILAQQKLIVRLVTRYRLQNVTFELEKAFLNFIIEDQRNRIDLALLWLAELYAQVMGFSYCIVPGITQLSKEESMIRYDSCMCNLLGVLYHRGEHRETLFHRIFLEVPYITESSITILRKACLDKLYGAFAMTTLRELILTRARQRKKLLELLLDFSYYERIDIREHSVRTTKELYEIDYVRSDVRNYVVDMSESLARPTPPGQLLFAHDRIDKKTLEVGKQILKETGSETDYGILWDDSLVRAGIYLFVSLLPIDHSLLQQLASICARASTDVTRVIFRCIDVAIKAIGMHSEGVLSMIEQCPESKTPAKGAETLVARIVSLLTEREAPTPELVGCMRTLHKTRNTDVRSLIPVLNGLTKEELFALIPKFVLEPKYSKSVPTFFKKIIFSKHIQGQEPLISPTELLVELHHIQTMNAKEKSHLITSLDLLLIDRDGEFRFTKDVYANAIEEMFKEQPCPPLLLGHSLDKIRDNHPALIGFISNITLKMAAAQKRSDLVPCHAAFGIDGDSNVMLEISVLKANNIDKSNYLLIGTTVGSCYLFSLDTYKMIGKIYEEHADLEGKRRQIMALGMWPSHDIHHQTNVDQEQINLDVLPKSSTFTLWIHFRGSSVSLFKCCQFVSSNFEDDNIQCSMEDLKLQFIRDITSTNHCAFCQTIDDHQNRRLFIPDMDGTDSVLNIRFQNGGEKSLVLGEEYLTNSYLKQQTDREIHLEHPDLFKGSLAGIHRIESLPEVGDLILLAFEDSTIGVFDISTKEIFDCLRHPKRREFVCWSILQRTADEELVVEIVISVMGQVYLTRYSPTNKQNKFQQGYPVRKCLDNVNCTCLSACLASDDKLTIVCGFTSGLIEIYKVTRVAQISTTLSLPQSQSSPSIEKLLQIDYHQHSIRNLKWLKKSCNDESGSKKQNQRLLSAASSDGKLTFFKISL